MPIVANTPSGKDFKIASEGTVQAVLNTVKDLGLIDTVFNGVAKKVHKVQFIWQLAELDDEKKPILIFERFTLSLHEKAQLHKRIKGLFGKQPPSTLDLEKLVGTNTNLVIVHNAGTDKTGQPKTYANVAATLKLQPNQAKLEIVPLDKIMKSNEVKQAVAATTNAITPENPISDLDIPF
jgi:hypothetical protein